MGVLGRGDADPLNVGIVWDAENRLTGVRQGATILASFAYDGLGRQEPELPRCLRVDAAQRLSASATCSRLHSPSFFRCPGTPSGSTTSGGGSE